MGTRRSPPTHAAIVAENLPLLARLGLTAEEAVGSCWACGASGRPNRAHVVARSYGGSNAPGNYFLLCGRCHAEQPDGASRTEQERWLLERPSELDHAVSTLKTWTEALALRVGSEAIVEAWLDAHAPGELAAILRDGYARAAGPFPGVCRANGLAALLEHLTAWHAAQGRP